MSEYMTAADKNQQIASFVIGPSLGLMMTDEFSKLVTGCIARRMIKHGKFFMIISRNIGTFRKIFRSVSQRT